MSKRSHYIYDYAARIDGRVNIWVKLPAPDPYLDEDPNAAEAYLKATGGWRAMAWQIIRVVDTIHEAQNWIYNRTSKGA
jgi:hypothetical protein|tara:strand:+ start:116 stop:352 length:237 start_codon:yes stop_codon:yes gene_type:complete